MGQTHPSDMQMAVTFLSGGEGDTHLVSSNTHQYLGFCTKVQPSGQTSWDVAIQSWKLGTLLLTRPSVHLFDIEKVSLFVHIMNYQINC